MLIEHARPAIRAAASPGRRCGGRRGVRSSSREDGMFLVEEGRIRVGNRFLSGVGRLPRGGSRRHLLRELFRPPRAWRRSRRCAAA
ncbi:MAG: hypothetical protein MZV70_64225 [Desulfobacterales bacterium]|nr:hypothetical protein [Desulfobacterales bacterium]